ncbi:NBS-LRR type resistance protein [Cucumis melo var. makuwa]|uniref:NBS-LRR type resistance protein n=1 Tax=Cucumis melo var. makuwa TaxID=1194695 RepID=A0A5A7VB78_CUCMM|nr:NBS-LRR type resistance protein [Cucumis melo var. makuwa]
MRYAIRCWVDDQATQKALVGDPSRRPAERQVQAVRRHLVRSPHKKRLNYKLNFMKLWNGLNRVSSAKNPFPPNSPPPTALKFFLLSPPLKRPTKSSSTACCARTAGRISKILSNPSPDSPSDVPNVVVQVIDLKAMGNRYMVCEFSFAQNSDLCFVVMVFMALNLQPRVLMVLNLQPSACTDWPGQ